MIPWLKGKIIKHQDDQGIKKLHLRHISISYRRPYELLHGYDEIFQKEIYRFVSTSKEPLIIDCGSNIGLSVLYFKNLYPSARIIAFEPDAGNFSLLETNIKNNNLSHIEIHQSAVWITNGKISFVAKESEASHIVEDGSTNQVEATRLNDVLEKYEILDLLKLDIEGAEYKVILDIKANLSKVENLFVEYHGKVEETNKLNSIMSVLSDCGFSVYIKNAADNLPSPFSEKRTNTPFDVQLNLFCYK